MTWPAPGRDQNEVEADIEIHERRAGADEKLGGTDEASALTHLQRLGGRLHVAPRLDLDEDEAAPAPDHEVYLTGLRLHPPRKNAVALELKEKSGQRLRSKARSMRGAAPCGVAPHSPSSPESASARA